MNLDLQKKIEKFLLDEGACDVGFAKLPDGNDIKEIQTPEIDYSNSNADVYEEHLPQVLTAITAPGVARQNKDFYPLYIANYVLGGVGLNSRINKSAREEEGLTYGAYTGLSLLNSCPLIQGGFSTTPENLSMDFLQKRNQYIENVTLERVNLVAKKYFSPEKLIMINLGKTK